MRVIYLLSCEGTRTNFFCCGELMLNVVWSEVTVSLKQQGEAALGRSVYAVLEWGC